MSVDYFQHETAVVDPGAKIGPRTKIWHFCHVSSGALIGADCVLGQNVYVAGSAVIGDNVKIQNNVSIYDGVVIDTDSREALVKSLGDNNALILRNHGLLTTGASIPEAFNAMHRLELSCKTQIAAMSCNTKLVDVSTQVVEATYQNYQPHVRRPFGVLDWPALLRKLDRIDPGFRD